MAWASQESGNGNGKEILEYPYNRGISIVNISPNTSREFVLLTGDLDPTKSWISPITKWVHSWKSPRNGIVTYISMNYMYACPIAYMNEEFKLKNPDYKLKNQKLPYPLTKKVLCPVYDRTLGKTIYLLAGREIEQQVDFIIQSNPSSFTGFVRISRMGSGLDTKYRVDMIPPFEYPVDKVCGEMIPLQDFDTSLTPDEFRNKTGIDTVTFWHEVDKKVSQGAVPIDTTKWGVRFGVDAFGASPAPVETKTIPVEAKVTQLPVVDPSQAGIPSSFDDLMAVKCASGMFKDKTIKEAFERSGLPVLLFLSKGGSDTEKLVAQALLTIHKDKLESLAKKEVF